VAKPKRSSKASWKYLPGGWLRLELPDSRWEGWTIDVLADYVGGRMRCVGLRIEPPEGRYLSRTTLGAIDPQGLSDLAKAAWTLDADALPVLVRNVREDGRKPYGGSENHRQAVREVVQASEMTPARAVMQAFGVTRATAYRWIKDAREDNK
jgi:hypothetical protein